MLLPVADLVGGAKPPNALPDQPEGEQGHAPVIQGFELFMAMLLDPHRHGPVGFTVEGDESRVGDDGWRSLSMATDKLTGQQVALGMTAQAGSHALAVWQRQAPMVTSDSQPPQPVCILDIDETLPYAKGRLSDQVLPTPFIPATSYKPPLLPMPSANTSGFHEQQPTAAVMLDGQQQNSLEPVVTVSEQNAKQAGRIVYNSLEQGFATSEALTRRYSNCGRPETTDQSNFIQEDQAPARKTTMALEPKSQIQALLLAPASEHFGAKAPVQAPVVTEPQMQTQALPPAPEHLAAKAPPQAPVETQPQVLARAPAPVSEPLAASMPAIHREPSHAHMLPPEGSNAQPAGVHGSAERPLLSGAFLALGSQPAVVSSGQSIRTQAPVENRHAVPDALKENGMAGGLAGTKLPSQAGTSTSPAGIQHAVPVLSQVVRKMSVGSLKHGEAQRLTLKLEPDHLGRVEVLVTARSDRLEIVMQADSPAAVQVLRENIQDLTRALTGKAEGRWTHIDVRIVESARPDQDSDDQKKEHRERSRDQDHRDDPKGRRHGQHGQ